MLKYIFSVLIFASSCSAGDCDNLNKETCGVLKNFTVADESRELKFNHLCSELDNYNGQEKRAYGFFSSFNKTYKALVLAEVYVGWLAHPSKKESHDTGIGLDLEKMRLQSLKEWANQPFSLALRIKNAKTNQLATGNFSKTFFYSYEGSGYPKDKKYTVGSKGDLDWEKLKEPEEKDQTSSNPSAKKNEYKGSESIHISSKALNQTEQDHILYLVLKNEKTGQEITLQGPVLKNLKSELSIKYSGPKVLTWGMFNPWQEGSLPEVFFDIFRYGDCIYLRKQAKKEFAKLFAKH